MTVPHLPAPAARSGLAELIPLSLLAHRAKVLPDPWAKLPAPGLLATLAVVVRQRLGGLGRGRQAGGAR